MKFALLKNSLFALFGWLILIYFWGYTLGIEDQQEILPYVKYLHNSLLYPSDFFIQNIASTIPNERWIFAHLLLPFINHFDPLLLIFHCFSTVLLLLGMKKVGSLFIKNELWTWVCIYLSLTFFYLYTLGGCDLYYNTFEASNLAKAIGIWAIYFYLKDKIYTSIAMLVGVTYIQLIVGLDLAIVLLLILLIQKKYRTFLYASLIYGLGAGIYLLFILKARGSSAGIDMNDYFKIMFEFRHPHHFIFSKFPLQNILFIGLLFAIGMYYFFKNNISLFWFFTFVLISTVLYAIGVDVLHNVTIGNFNGYKNTIWIKFFGLIALFSIAEKILFKKNWQIPHTNLIIITILIISNMVMSWGLIFTNHLNMRKMDIYIGNRIYQDPLVDISLQIKNKTPQDALFLVPFHATGFKYWSERSSYVDFKANTRNPLTTKEWYNRLHAVYGISTESRAKGFELKQIADTFYSHQYFCSLSRFKNKKVQYFLCTKDHPKMEQYEPPIIENKAYKVYFIDPKK